MLHGCKIFGLAQQCPAWQVALLVPSTVVRLDRMIVPLDWCTEGGAGEVGQWTLHPDTVAVQL